MGALLSKAFNPSSPTLALPYIMDYLLSYIFLSTGQSFVTNFLMPAYPIELEPIFSQFGYESLRLLIC